jgi:RsiW-degrading membrane proteinase PrsW (M82 family)
VCDCLALFSTFLIFFYDHNNDNNKHSSLLFIIIIITYFTLSQVSSDAWRPYDLIFVLLLLTLRCLRFPAMLGESITCQDADGEGLGKYCVFRSRWG